MGLIITYGTHHYLLNSSLVVELIISYWTCHFLLDLSFLIGLIIFYWTHHSLLKSSFCIELIIPCSTHHFWMKSSFLVGYHHYFLISFVSFMTSWISSLLDTSPWLLQIIIIGWNHSDLLKSSFLVECVVTQTYCIHHVLLITCWSHHDLFITCRLHRAVVTGNATNHEYEIIPCFRVMMFTHVNHHAFSSPCSSRIHRDWTLPWIMKIKCQASPRMN